jgi:hypothetical protein
MPCVCRSSRCSPNVAADALVVAALLRLVHVVGVGTEHPDTRFIATALTRQIAREATVAIVDAEQRERVGRQAAVIEGALEGERAHPLQFIAYAGV